MSTASAGQQRRPVMNEVKAVLKFFYEFLFKSTFGKFVIYTFFIGISFTVLDAITGGEPSEVVESLVIAFAMTWASDVDEKKAVKEQDK